MQQGRRKRERERVARSRWQATKLLFSEKPRLKGERGRGRETRRTKLDGRNGALLRRTKCGGGIVYDNKTSSLSLSLSLSFSFSSRTRAIALLFFVNTAHTSRTSLFLFLRSSSPSLLLFVDVSFSRCHHSLFCHCFSVYTRT